MKVGLPPGIKETSPGYRVRVSTAVGSKSMVTRHYPTLHDAYIAHSRGNHAKRMGEDVAAAMDEGQARHVPAPIAPASPPPVRTFKELVEYHLERRKRLSETCNTSRRSSKRKGHISLRPTTYKSDCRRIKTRLLPEFGDMLLTDISQNKIEEWLLRLCAEGISTQTAIGYLNSMRFILRSAERHELPGSYPWHDANPSPPANPIKPKSDPSVWGGSPVDANPVLPFADLKALALATHAADRIVFYCEGLGGPRIGELYGLELRDLTYRDGYVWIKIERQITPENEPVPWVKSDAGYRTIPLAKILGDYLEQYCLRYHAYDIKNPDPSKAYRRLVVNPSGRDHDGTWLPGLRGGFSSRLVELREKAGFGRAKLGYAIDSHHFRKSCTTYLLNSEEIVTYVSLEQLGPEPDKSDVDAHMKWSSQRIHQLEMLRLGFSQMHISEYLGHEYDRGRDTNPASVVTLRHYNLSTATTGPFTAIADIVDYIARHEIGSLLDEPDEWDLLPVRFPHDPDWITTSQASEIIGINQSNVSTGVKKGRIEGHLAWLADGGHNRRTATRKAPPALPQLAISRKSAEAIAAINNKPTLSEAARRLGMSIEAVRRNFGLTGRLPIDATYANRFLVEEKDLEALQEQLFTAVLDVLETNGPCRVGKLSRLFNERHGDLFVEGRALERWIVAWTDMLRATGRITRHYNGTLAAN